MSDAPALEQGTLDNGVRYTIWDDPRDTVAAVQVWIDAGTADEPEGASGVAHMLEHMMFRGTPRVPDGMFDARTEALGLQVNAATWMDYTFYTATGPATAVPALLALEADRFANLVVEDDAFLPERDVVANERRQVVDAVPDGALGEAFMEALFDGSSYAWPTIGHAADIAAYSRQTVQRFYDEMYAPSRLHAVVVGNVDRGATLETLRQTLGTIPQRAQGNRRRTQRRDRPRRDTLAIAASSARAFLGWDAPTRRDTSWASWVVLEELLAAAESSRLTQRLDYEDRLVVDVGSMLFGLRDRAAVEVALTLRPGVAPDDAVDAVFDELRLLVDEGVTDDEVAGAIARVRMSQASALSDTSGRAESLGESFVLTGDATDGLALTDRVSRVTRDDVVAAAATMLANEPVVYHGVPQ